jgi:hypothetical protein
MAYSRSAMAILRDPVERAIQVLAAEAESLPNQDPEAAGWGALALRSARLGGISFDREVWNHFVPGLTAPAAGGALKEAIELLVSRARLRSREPPAKHPVPWPITMPSGRPRGWYWGMMALAYFDPQGSTWKRWNERMKWELLSTKESDPESLAFRALTFEVYYPDIVYGGE